MNDRVNDEDKNWVRDPDSLDDGTMVWHLDGIPWDEAIRPHRFHNCETQTYGLTTDNTMVRRCACGAISVNDVWWKERNSRRAARRNKFNRKGK